MSPDYASNVTVRVLTDDLALLRRAAEELLGAANDEAAVLDRAVTLLNDHFGYGTHYILLHDPISDELYVATAVGIGSERPAVRGYRAPLSVALAVTLRPPIHGSTAAGARGPGR